MVAISDGKEKNPGRCDLTKDPFPFSKVKQQCFDLEQRMPTSRGLDFLYVCGLDSGTFTKAEIDTKKQILLTGAILITLT